MAESKLVPPPPSTRRKAPRARIAPAPRPAAKPAAPEEIELGESAIMAIEHLAPPAIVTELSLDDLQLDEPAAAAVELLSKPAPPLTAPIAVQPVEPTPQPAETVEDEVDWDQAIANAKAAGHDEPPQVSRGMSDRMGAVEALSTIEPTPPSAPAQDVPFAGETFADDVAPDFGRPRFTPTRIGLVSAAASALLIAAVHLMGSSSANANPEVASEEPVKVIHAAAAFNEATEDTSSREDEQAQDYAVIDNVKARKLGTVGMRALREGRTATAKRLFDKALAANPRSRLALAGLGRHALERKRYAEAVKYLEQAVKIEPRKADNRRYLGDAYAGLGRTRRAKAQYDKAVEYGDSKAGERLANL